jgi:hypothetical protein
MPTSKWKAYHKSTYQEKRLFYLNELNKRLSTHAHSSTIRYLGFRWKGITFQIRTTPFDLSVIPWYFSRITKPILLWARQLGMSISTYLDYWILMAESQALAQRQTSQRLTNSRTLAG